MPKTKRKSSTQRRKEISQLMTVARSDADRREQERENDRERRRSWRQIEDNRSQEREQDMQRRATWRQDEKNRTQEREKDRLQREIWRQNEDNRSHEQETDTSAHADRRNNPVLRRSERVRDREQRRVQRENTPVRTAEQLQNTQQRSRIRQDSVRRRLEFSRIAANQTRRRKDQNWESLLQEFIQEKHKAPIFICSCCGCCWYEDNISSYTRDELMEKELDDEFLNKILCIQSASIQLCGTCKKKVLKKKIPRLCLTNGLDFPPLPPELAALSPLEERLLALRIPFMQIKVVGSERQLKLKGNIVNVENDLDVCAKAIPRRFNEMMTIQLKFSRRLSDRVPVWYEVIRPAVVDKAKQYLLNTELYIENNIEARDDFAGFQHDDTIRFTSPDSDDAEHNDRPLESEELQDEEAGNTEEWEDLEETTAEETMYFNQLGTNGIHIAPGEGKIPIPLYSDPSAEEMAFPKIYCGQKRKIKSGVKLTYTDIAKSECLRADRRCAVPQKVLYACKKSFNEKVRQNIQINLRKRTGRNKITASQIRNKEFLQNLMTKDLGYTVLKNLRSSPTYWANKTKDVIAMVRQLGKCAFFITLSAAETKWTELLVTLMYLLKGKTITEDEAAVLSFDEKSELIRSDPITCMRHFDRRIRKAHTLLMKREHGIFAPYKLQDWFRRVEFQMRGSPHSHGLYWIENAPEYNEHDPGTEDDCVDFIDEFISVDRCEDGAMKELIKKQVHKHSATCKIIPNKRDCRFGYPLPPLPRTMILHPLPKETNRRQKQMLQALYQKIHDKLKARGRNPTEPNISFEDFLTQLVTTEREYILAIRRSIKRVTVFHKREVNAAYINRYNRKLLEAWQANMDIQFVTNTFACAKYCVGYILKSDGGLSKLMKSASQKAKGNDQIKEKLKQFVKILLNGTEISAQEAAGFLLGLANTHSTRQCVYVNTAPPDDRVQILKPDKDLLLLEENSEDICQKGDLDRYVCRPDELEDISLAEFISNYQFEKKKANARAEDNSDDSDDNASQSSELPISRKLPRYPLTDGSGVMRRRSVRKVIRFRNFGRQQDPKNYWREQLMLFIPWRDEELELLLINPIEFGQLFLNEITENSKQFYKQRDITDTELNDALLVAQNEVDEEDNESDISWFAEDNDILAEAFLNPEINPNDARARVETFRPTNMVPDEDFTKIMRSLNNNQRRVVMDYLHRLKTSEEQFCTFLSGGAGVGKSHAITAIVQSVLRYFGSVAFRDPTETPVIVMAFTGKAAFNVAGMTLHHTLRILPNQSKGRMRDLDDGVLNSLRKKLRGIKLIIIDEISMVSVKMLFQVDQRLRQVFGNNQDFGGIPVLAVGHFRQLPPIAASFVFDNPSHLPNGTCSDNYLWKNNFMLYELTEIMRQKGEADFCKALNNMAEGIMDDEDISLIKSREIGASLQPPEDAVWLFKTNIECSKHNDGVHARLDTEGAMSIARDKVQGSGTEEVKCALLDAAQKWSISECDGLRYETYLKIGGEYFISTNIDVSDGLFNGGTGTLKAIEYSRNGHTPTRIWMDFKNPLVGCLKRKSAWKLIEARASVNPSYRDWVPIERIQKALSKSFMHAGLQLVRFQMPVIACNGMTVAKSQGSTLPCVVVSAKGAGRRKLTRQEMYVACSRATCLSGLFINGDFVPPSPPELDDPVSFEMERLKKSPYQFVLRFLQDLPLEVSKLYYHNIQSFRAHIDDAIADPCVMSADVLAFVEPKLLSEDQIEVPNFHVVHRTNCRGLRRKRRLILRNSEGALLLFKSHATNTNPVIVTSFGVEGHCLLMTFEFKGISFTIMYKSPKYSKADFKKMLVQRLSTNNSNVIYAGDINIDLSKSENADIVNLFAEYGLHTRLDIGCASTNLGTHIDICFSDISSGLDCSYYESYSSYHKPICISWAT